MCKTMKGQEKDTASQHHVFNYAFSLVRLALRIEYRSALLLSPFVLLASSAFPLFPVIPVICMRALQYECVVSVER